MNKVRKMYKTFFANSIFVIIFRTLYKISIFTRAISQAYVTHTTIRSKTPSYPQISLENSESFPSITIRKFVFRRTSVRRSRPVRGTLRKPYRLKVRFKSHKQI